MIPGALARRYARALLGLAPTPVARDKYAKDLTALTALAKQPDETGTPLLSILSTRRFPPSQRKKVLESFGRKLAIDPMVIKFLCHAIDKDRIVGLPEITRAYVRMADDTAGRMQAEVISAAPLSSDAASKLQQALALATGKTIVLTTKVDPELLGGVITKIGSYVIDGSLRAALGRMRTGLHT